MTSREPIEEVLDGYRTAVSAKDVDAFVALYDEDVRVFDIWGRWSYDGADEWRQMAVEWFGSLGNDQVAVGLHDVDTVIGDGVAAAHAVATQGTVGRRRGAARDRQSAHVGAPTNA